MKRAQADPSFIERLFIADFTNDSGPACAFGLHVIDELLWLSPGPEGDLTSPGWRTGKLGHAIAFEHAKPPFHAAARSVQAKLTSLEQLISALVRFILRTTAIGNITH